ncbi:MAG: GatB/YqeY domain-containing protein [Gaiellales bacterium]|nr:GatB/YqeY domain-containing protein [Gaiellales bacterium]
MSLAQEVQSRVKDALKSGARDQAASLRVLLSELQRMAKEARRELSQEEEVQVLKREKKKHQEAVEGFKAGGRQQAVEKEEWMIGIIDELLPQQLDEAALAGLIDQVITETGASSPKEMGKVMSALMDRAGTQVDGRLASRLVKERLTA